MPCHLQSESGTTKSCTLYTSFPDFLFDGVGGFSRLKGRDKAQGGGGGGVV